MADKTLRFLLLGEDRSASKTLAGVGKAVGALAGVLTAAKLVEWGKDAVDAFRGAEASQRQLEDAYRRFPAVQNVAIGALRDYNQALQDKVGADADDLAASQAVLARYKLTGTQLKSMTPLLVDYAFRTGKELPAAAGVLGKAMMGNARAMKELGIEFKDTGDPAKNFEQIMTGLQEKVGGFAEGEAQTLDGKMRQLSVRFGDVQEAVGGRLVPALDGLLTFVLDNEAALVPLAGALAAVTVATLAFAGGLKALEALKAARAAVDALKVSIDGMTTKARASVIAMGAVGVALAAAAAIYGLVAGAQAEAEAAVESYTEAIRADSGALGENTRMLIANRLEKSGALAAAQKLGVSTRGLVDAVMGEGDALQRLRTRALAVIEAYHQRKQGTVEQLRAAEALLGALDKEGGALAESVASYRRQTEAAKGSASAVADLDKKIRALKSKIVEAKAKGAKESSAEVQALRSKIAALQGKTVTVTAKIVKGASSLWGVIGKSFQLADGGIVRAYAGGGFENHTAQIAPGTMRVWAEPETGGEAYIPLAPSKRSRSLAIWRETGRRLGVEGMADGGISGGSGLGSLADEIGRAVARHLEGTGVRLTGARRFADDLAAEFVMAAERGI